MEQEAEGNSAVFDAMLCNPATGEEVAAWKAGGGGGDGGLGFRRRFNGGGGTKGVGSKRGGGLVMCGDEYGDGVGWRIGKDMEGSVLTWRIGGEIWVSYWANEVKSGLFETRCVEWCDEVDLPLIPLTKSVV